MIISIKGSNDIYEGEDDDKYNTEKLPELLSILERYEEGSPSYQLYMKRIEDDMALQAKHYAKQIEAVSQRQSQIIDGFLQSKDKILEQTGQITAGMLATIQNQILTLDINSSRGTEAGVTLFAEKEKLALSEGSQQIN